MPGAQATEADLDVVRRDMMAHAPYDALWFLDHYGITVVVTRGAVTTEWPRLRDGLPRGYIAQSMDSVTGIYDAARRRAIIATQDDGKGNRRMPDAREEGSVDAALHEGGHGVNSRSTWFGLMSDKDDYKAVYEQDGRKGAFADRYFHQENASASRDEAWAEGFAMYFRDPTAMQRNYPAMFSYFQAFITRELKEHRQ